MQDSQVIWMDGKVVPYANAQIHVLAHSLHYGGGVFEGMRAYQTADGQTCLFRAEEHLQRFLDSMRTLGYPSRYTREELIAACKEMVKANQFTECYVRPIAYINDSVRGLKLPSQPEINIAIATWNWGKYLGGEGQKNGVRIKVSTFRRQEPGTAFTMAKLSGPYLYSVMARREATLSGYDEALLLDPQGFVGEGSGENVFMVKGGIIYTPSLGYILPGITRDCIIKIARYLGFTVIERPITRNELYLADEVFFTGTAAEVTPVREIDNLTIGAGKPGPVSQKISDTFFQCVKGSVPEFRSWLSPV